MSATAPRRASKRTRFKWQTEDLNPERFNLCYSDWRSAVGFSREQEDAFKDLISANCGSDDWDSVQQFLRRALRCGVPPTHLVVGLLYSWYHIQSPHTSRVLISLLDAFGDRMGDISAVTCISKPCYNVAHVSAMAGSTQLLQRFFAHGGDVNVCDTRNVSPIYIALGNSHFNCLNTLLWMDAVIQLSKVLNFTRDISMESLKDLIHHFKVFVADIELSIDLLKDAFAGHSEVVADLIDSGSGNGQLLNADCADVIIFEMLLPMTAYRSVKRLLEEMKAERGYEWDEVVEDSFTHSREDSYRRLSAIGIGARVDIHRVFEGNDAAKSRSLGSKRLGANATTFASKQYYSTVANAFHFGMDLSAETVSVLPTLGRQRSFFGVDSASKGYSRQITFFSFVCCVATGVYIVWRQTYAKTTRK